MMASSVGDVVVHSNAMAVPSDVEALVQAAVSVLTNDIQVAMQEQSQVQVVMDGNIAEAMQVESVDPSQVQVMVDSAQNLHERLYMCTDCNIAFYGETGEQEWQWHLKQHRPFKCELCPETFELKDTLQQHMRSHSVQMPYICEHCGSAYSLKTNLQLHLKVHETNDVYRCNQCECVFKYQQHLEKHMKFHTGESIKVYQCEECSKTFSQQKNLVQHMKIHQGVEKPFKCTECPATYSFKCHLQRHLIIHTGEKPYRCKFCAKSFNRNAHLIRHRKIHTSDEKQWKCDQCNFAFWEKSDLYRHVRSHAGNRPLTCQFCPQTFVWKRYLLKHLNNHHKTDERYFCFLCCACLESPERLEEHEKTAHANKKQLTHTCSICNDEFHFKFKLDEHMFVHTGQKAYKCDKCDMSFISRKELERHTELHAQEISFHCNTCNKTFASIDELQAHLKVHTGRGKFACTVCASTFKWKSQLTTHMVTHADTRAFQCSHCDKEFKRMKDLKRHVRIYHETKPPYTCTDCEQDFHTPWNLHQHERKGHQGKYSYEFECNFCSGAFKKESDWKRHTDKVHPPRPFRCNTCYKRFSMIKFLHKHLELKHGVLHLIEGETYTTVRDQKTPPVDNSADYAMKKAETIIIDAAPGLEEGMEEIEKFEEATFTAKHVDMNDSNADHVDEVKQNLTVEDSQQIKIETIHYVSRESETVQPVVTQSPASKVVRIPRVVSLRHTEDQPTVRIIKQVQPNFKVQTIPPLQQGQNKTGVMPTPTSGQPVVNISHSPAVTAQLPQIMGQGQTVYVQGPNIQQQPISEAITLANIHRGHIQSTETDLAVTQQQTATYSQLQSVPNLTQLSSIPVPTSVLNFTDADTNKSGLVSSLIDTYNMAASATGNLPMRVMQQSMEPATGSLVPHGALQVGSQQQETSNLLPQVVEIQNFAADGSHQIVIESLPAADQ